MIAKWIVIAILILGALATTAQVGLERKPVEAKHAVYGWIITLVVVWLIVNGWRVP